MGLAGAESFSFAGVVFSAAGAASCVDGATTVLCSLSTCVSLPFAGLLNRLPILIALPSNAFFVKSPTMIVPARLEYHSNEVHSA